jgi:membrane protein
MTQFKQWFTLITHIQQRYVADGCSHSAAALTYMSLFAVVPLMTVMYAVLSAVPAYQEVGLQVQGFIFKNFIPSTGQEVQGYLEQFSQQARNLTGVGVVFLGITAVMMLKNIEKIFNAIWRTRENRKGLSSFLLYWAILSLGPICIGLALGISTYLVSLKVVFDQVDVIGIGPHLLRASPYLLTGAAFTLLFAAVPNCKVPIKHALAGGFVTALAFEIAKQLFAGIVANTSFQSIYGTFAAMPLFLLWIYLSWLIVLAGAELTHALNSLSPRAKNNNSEFTVAVNLLELLWRRHQQALALKEQYLLHKPWLFNQYSINNEQWTALRDKLLEAKLMGITQSGDYVLGRDLNHFTLWELSQLINQDDPVAASATAREPLESLPYWFEQCQEQLEAARQHKQNVLSTPLALLFSLSKVPTQQPEFSSTSDKGIAEC